MWNQIPRTKLLESIVRIKIKDLTERPWTRSSCLKEFRGKYVGGLKDRSCFINLWRYFVPCLSLSTPHSHSYMTDSTSLSVEQLGDTRMRIGFAYSFVTITPSRGANAVWVNIVSYCGFKCTLRTEKWHWRPPINHLSGWKQSPRSFQRLG